jgi:sorbitol-specific phosphotransferase system component IIBC
VIGHGTFTIICRMIVLSPWLGGCSVMSSLHVGDVTLGLQSGFASIGSHVGLFIH